MLGFAPLGALPLGGTQIISGPMSVTLPDDSDRVILASADSRTVLAEEP